MATKKRPAAKKKPAAKKRGGNKKAELKTKETSASVDAFLAKLDAARRDDCRAIVAMMKKATGAPPKMWGTAIVGFGQYHYRYESGREGDMPVAAFSPRAQAITLYLTPGFEAVAPQLAQLGPHKTGKGCLYIKRLADVDAKVLESLVRESVQRTRAMV